MYFSPFLIGCLTSFQLVTSIDNTAMSMFLFMLVYLWDYLLGSFQKEKFLGQLECTF